MDVLGLTLSSVRTEPASPRGNKASLNKRLAVHPPPTALESRASSTSLRKAKEQRWTTVFHVDAQGVLKTDSARETEEEMRTKSTGEDKLAG